MSLSQLYGINDVNLATRRAYIGLGEEELRVLARLRPWAHRPSEAMARELTDHTFEYGATGAFMAAHVAKKGITVDVLRQAWQDAQRIHFCDIFDEVSKPDAFGERYFEGLLHVGKLHNEIDLPLKWYIGAYATFGEIVARHLRRRFIAQPRLRAAARRAIGAVFNYDIQAVTDAFYF